VAGIRNQILILEDDETQVKALSEAFRREGFTVHATSRPAEAEHILEAHPIGTLIVDCLLPEISGVEFVQKIRSKYPEALLDVILMSALFKDPSFIKESLQSTQAKHFLKKPFELSEMISLVDKPVAISSEPKGPVSPRKALYELFSREKVGVREKKKAIEALEEIHGFDLPFIYNLLVESKTSGHLNVATTQGVVFGVTFAQGFIVNVDVPDKETYLGKLLLEGGYVYPQDLEKVFQDKASNKKVGEKLVTNFFVSPHALDKVLSEQMNIRISKTILDQNLNINFVESETELTSPNIAPELFGQFLHDWIVSKLSLEWLKAHFIQWANSTLVKTPHYRADHPALKAPLVHALGGVLDFIVSGLTLNQIIDSQKYQEESVFKTIHYLLTRGLLVFSSSALKLSPSDQHKYYKKLFAQFSGRSKFETYDLLVKMTGVKDSEPMLALREFEKILGSAPSSEQKEQFSLYQQLRTLSLQACEMAKAGGREKLKNEAQRGEVELKLKAASNFDEAKNLLQKSQFRQAFEMLRKVQEMDPQLTHLKVYILWSKIGMLEQEKNRAQALQQLELELLQVPPEEKFDAIYNFVQGLVAKAKNDLPSARKFFEKTIALDSTMMAARRELSILVSAATSAKPTDLFNRDLKDVVGSFFRRK